MNDTQLSAPIGLAGSLVGAIAALGGTWLTLWHTRKQSRADRHHDQTQKEYDALLDAYVEWLTSMGNVAASAARLKGVAKNDQQHLRIHTVLGPDLNHPDNVRLKALIRGVMEGQGRTAATHQEAKSAEYHAQARFYEIVQHPLCVQDFLSLPSIWNLHGLPVYLRRPKG